MVIFEGVLILRFLVKLLRKLKKAKLKILRFQLYLKPAIQIKASNILKILIKKKFKCEYLGRIIDNVDFLCVDFIFHQQSLDYY